MTDPVNTLLTISGPGVPPYASRGIKQTSQPIEAAKLVRRTVNGAIENLADSQFRKYASTITCTDQQSPALDGIWPGMTLTIGWVQELSYLTAGGSPSRTPVAGSSRVEGAYTFYRPVMSMMVIDYNVQTDEWGAEIGWTLNVEEV